MKQDYFSRSKYVNDKFDVSRGSRTGKMRFVTQNSGSPDTMIISGICVGVVSNTFRFDLDIDAAWSDNMNSMITLFHYQKTSSERRHTGPFTASNTMTLLNASWGPPKIVTGDIIIVSNVCNVPLVLRYATASTFHFVGGCCLVDSVLQGVADEFADLATDPGFSDIMHGSAWDESRVEQFRIL